MPRRVKPHKATAASMPKRGWTSKPRASSAVTSPTAERDEAESAVDPVSHKQLVWPRHQMPVELFQLICSYLPRESVQSMRLVCSEFDRMVSAHYFRNVVAPFRAALYSSPELWTDQAGSAANNGRPAGGDSSSISRVAGMRTVFDAFGEHIRSFALALELNEVHLAYPPLKMTQEVVRTPWGLYRWPKKNYQRYSDLEAIEDQADETALMSKAFSKLTKLTELGLSCDAGLGFLQGSDLNPNVPQRFPRVFESARYPPAELDRNARPVTKSEGGKASRDQHLVQMMANAGFSQEQTPAAIETLLRCEGRRFREDDDSPDQTADLATRLARPDPLDIIAIVRGSNPPLALIDGPNGVELVRVASSAAKADSCPPPYPLTPRALTKAQKEMLLELSWAHDALVQSYVISVIDNPQVFGSVTSLTISRIPASLLHILIRPAFWDSLSAIEEFRLGVIPDWRQVSKENGMIEDRFLSPNDACEAVHILLKMCVAPRRTIRKLHFEWICGGELAAGLSQRNRYVMPAPFVEDAVKMVSPTIVVQSPDSLLSLPHIRELSLKNCYFSPHVLLRTLRDMSAASLTTLKLETVSLTGPPLLGSPTAGRLMGHDRSEWPWPLCIRTANPGRSFSYEIVQPAPGALGLPGLNQVQVFYSTFGTQAVGLQTQQTNLSFDADNDDSDANAPAPLPTPVPLADDDDATKDPRVPPLLSWAHILNELTPHKTIEWRCRNTLGPDGRREFQVLAAALARFVGPQPGKHVPRGLPNVEIRSCGYVIVDVDYVDSNEIVPTSGYFVEMPLDTLETLRRLDAIMLRCSDPRLGKILDHYREHEMGLLKHYFGMRFGWEGVYSEEECNAAYDDGFLSQGRGRFTGSWRADEPVPALMVSDEEAYDTDSDTSWSTIDSHVDDDLY